MSDDPTRRMEPGGDPQPSHDPASERTQRLERPAAASQRPPPAAPPAGPPPGASGGPPGGWAPQPRHAAPQAAPLRVVRHRTSGAAVTALVLGILALTFGVLPLLNVVALLLGLLAVLFGIGGMAATSRDGVDGRGMAVGGLVCGLLGVVAAMALLFVMNAAFTEVRQAFGDGSFEERLQRRLERRLEQQADEPQALGTRIRAAPTARSVSV